MENQTKYDLIIDAFQELLENTDIQHISVNDIAKKAGIGKGSIYYYFPSKDAILNAMIKRTYKSPLQLAKELESQTSISPSQRVARIYLACCDASRDFLKKSASASSTDSRPERIYDSAYMHQQFMKHIIAEFKPTYATIIKQGIENGDFKFDYPDELAEMIIIFLTVKIDNTLSPATEEDIARSFQALISLLEKGTDNPLGSFNLKV